MKQMNQCSKAVIVACLFLGCAFYSAHTFAQSAGFNYTGAKPHVSALLDISDSAAGAGGHKGLLIPRMTLSNRNSISSPATSLIIYQTDNTPGFYYNSGTAGSPAWINIVASGGGGSSQWITATSPTTAITYTVGSVGIGTMSPSYKLSLATTTTVIADRTIGINTTPVVYLPDQSTLDGSIAFGTGLRSLTSGTGKFNTAVGIGALLSTTTGVNNTAIGYEPLKTNTTGSNNVVMGYQSLYYNTTGSYNTAIGANVLVDNTTGSSNVGVGEASLNDNTTGAQNTAVGVNALNFNTTGTSNTGIGFQALRKNTTGSNNAALGLNALYNNTTGSYNVALGHYALFTNTTGDYNIACGAYALQYNTTGTSNFANGVNALQANTTGSFNTAEGYQALAANKSGNSNTANGYQALNSDTGAYNTAMGTRALYLNVSGNYNTSLGYRAGYDVTSGSNNTFLGSFPTTGVGITTGSNNILIGYDVRYGLSQTTSNQLNIGNLIYASGLGSGNTASTGKVGIGTGTVTPTAVLHLKAGTASANTAPLKLTSGTNLTTAEAGAVEYDGTNFFVTNSTATRYTVAKVLTSTATLDFASTGSGAVADLTITVTGAAVGDAVVIGVPNGSVSATASFTGWVSASNTVTVRFSPKATEDPSSGTFKATVIKD